MNKFNELEDYVTPPWCVEDLIECNPFLYRGYGAIFDPCGGYGTILDTIRNRIGDNTTYISNDINPEYYKWLRQERPYIRPMKVDFSDPSLILEVNKHISHNPGPVCLITNPPFSRTMEILNQYMDLCSDVIILQRLAFLASSKRCNYMKNNMPDVYVLPRRPSFTANGATDRYEYAWFHWSPNRNRNAGRVSILPMRSTKKGNKVLNG